MMRQYQLYYKQKLVCETTSRDELRHYFLIHYQHHEWKVEVQNRGCCKKVTLPNYNPAELINMLYSDKLVNYQLNLRATHTEQTKFSIQAIGLETFLQQQGKNK